MPRDAVRIVVQSIRSVFDITIEFRERFYPSGKDSFWTFESFEPFQAVIISAYDDMCAK